MNLISAVIVDSAIAQGGQDRDMRRRMLRRKVQKLKPHIEGLFDELVMSDGSEDGQLRRDSLKVQIDAMRQEAGAFGHLPPEIKEIVESDKLVDMFEFIDGDGSGTIDLQEFYYGVSFLALQTSSVQAIPTET